MYSSIIAYSSDELGKLLMFGGKQQNVAISQESHWDVIAIFSDYFQAYSCELCI